MLSNYEKATELIIKNGDLFSSGFGPCCDEAVQKIEKMLSLKFPKDYVRFLKTFGALTFGGAEVFGIFHDEIDGIYVGNMVRETLEERNEWKMPSNLIVIEDTGWDGELYCLQINENDPDKSPVVIYVHPTVPIEVLAPDFGTFLLDLVQQEIEYQRNEANKE